MKRKQQFEDAGARRQPQVSCDFCRNKKLKCDRGTPCQSCKVRNIQCSNGLKCSEQFTIGSTGVSPQTRRSTDDIGTSILARLNDLERAVFGCSRTGVDISAASKDVSSICSGRVSATSQQRMCPQTNEGKNQHLTTATFLDSTYTSFNPSILGSDRVERFHIAPTRSSRSSYGNSADCQHRLNAYARDTTGSATTMMTRWEAISLYEDFIDNTYHLLLFLRHSSTRSLIDNFYDQLERGVPGDPACAALILSIAATSASLFNSDSCSSIMFASVDEASSASKVWTHSALNVLQGSHQWASGRLEECLARTILAYVIYTSEGCSARFRFQHSCSVACARDLSLHLIDTHSPSDPLIEPAVKEFSRRLWWHIASTDWLLAFMGSPLDGTYTVQPRHMNVRFPRNLNDHDLEHSDDSFERPISTATQVSAFILRIQLSEICRAIVDARAVYAPENETLDLPTVLQLDALFEKTLSDLPPFLKFGSQAPPDAPRHLTLQRDLILLGLHTRRARLHRPFVIRQQENEHFQIPRERCLDSTRTVVSICVQVLERSQGGISHPAVDPAMINRLGIVISAIFMACTVLALDAGMKHDQTENDGKYHCSLKHVNPQTHEELVRAFRLLASTGKHSALTAALVGGLRGVLKNYRLAGVVEDVRGEDTGYVMSGKNRNHSEENSSSTWSNEELPQASQISNGIDTVSDLGNLWEEFSIPILNAYELDQLFDGLENLSADQAEKNHFL